MHISSRNEEDSVSKTNNSLNISIDSLSEILDLEDCGSLNAKIDCRDRISGILETFSSDSDLLESLLLCCQKTVSHMRKIESCLISKEAAHHESDIESATIMGDLRKTMHLSSAIKKSKKYCKEDEQFVTDLFLQCSIEEQFKLIISSAKSNDDLVSINFRVKIIAENFNF